MARETLVIYDISDDGLRLRVSKVCESFGLVRIQKSAFLGKMESSYRKELIAKLRMLLNREGCDRDNIQVFVFSSQCLYDRVIIGRQFGVKVEERLLYI